MYHLFEVTGIELEYMIVNKDKLNVLPIADKVLFSKNDGQSSDVLNGDIDWSNELVSHVLEIKTHQPVTSLKGIHNKFHQNILEINTILEKENAKLLGTGAHPTMDPHTECVIWPHEHNEIYALYDKIFGCKGHGWSNLQSMHINLPFNGDEEFSRLHAAIRAILPLIPTLGASTPILDGQLTGYVDTRLEYYRKNQAKIPSITGMVIPEKAFSKDAYHKMIFDPIVKDIKPYDTEGVLEYHFLNSRGAIARFDRGAIEIRLIDLQESPVADLALAELFVEVLKELSYEKWNSLEELQALEEKELFELLVCTIKTGDRTIIYEKPLLKCFGISKSEISVQSFWDTIINQLSLSDDTERVLENILKNGNLSSRIIRKMGKEFDVSQLTAVYHELSDCLSKNDLFQ